MSRIKGLIDRHRLLFRVVILALIVSAISLLGRQGGADYVTNIYTELIGVVISVGFTVVFVDTFYERRDRERREAQARRDKERETQELKERLLLDVGSRSNDIALSAADHLHNKRWVMGETSLLKGKSLVEANLKCARFPGANLEDVNFQNTTLDKANLIRANLKGTILRGASLREAKLSRAKLQGAFMDFTILQGAFMERAELQGNNLLLSKLQNADLKGACLERTKMWATNLEGTNMQAANLKDADLQGAFLKGATLPQKENLEGTIFPDGTTFTASMEYEELERFTDPCNARFDEASADAKDFRDKKGLFWDEVKQPYRVIYKPDIW